MAATDGSRGVGATLQMWEQLARWQRGDAPPVAFQQCQQELLEQPMTSTVYSSEQLQSMLGSENAYFGTVLEVAGQKWVVEHLLGAGAYGVVRGVRERDSRQVCAIKTLRRDPTPSDRRTFMLEHTFLSFVTTQAKGDKELKRYFVTYLGGCSLNKEPVLRLKWYPDTIGTYVERLNRSGSLASIEVVQSVALQLFKALSILERWGVVHGDLTASNVLLTEKLKVKIGDWGGSQPVGCETTEKYITTRYSRAPEVALNLHPYTEKIDLWSGGVLITYLWSGSHLFPGRTGEQCFMIAERIGMPPEGMLRKLSEGVREKAKRCFETHLQARPVRPLRDALLRGRRETAKTAPLLTVMERTLQWEPESRPSPQECVALLT